MAARFSPPKAIIFDLGDVLFTWSAKTATSVSPQEMRQILRSSIWHDYERGQLTREECYNQAAQKFSVAVADITEAFTQARNSLQPDDSVVQFLSKVRNSSHDLKIYAMSNIGKEDFLDLADKMDWTLFDRVFTSADAKTRKPEQAFYSQVLTEIDLKGSEVIFIDDKEENIAAAKLLGIQGHVFKRETVQDLERYLDTPSYRGWQYVLQNLKKMDSVTDSGIFFADNFAQLLVADTLEDPSLIDLTWSQKTTWNFFQGEAALVPGGHFPDDLDTTSLALAVLKPPRETVAAVLDHIADFANDDGTFQTYFDRKKPRTDLIVSLNILACFYMFGRDFDHQKTIRLAQDFLLNRRYLEGTRYYPSPDCCLGFVNRLVHASNDSGLRNNLDVLLKARLAERIGLDGNALDLSMRIISCRRLGLDCHDDCRRLASMQKADGSWNPGWMYRYGSTGVKIGNGVVTTAMAIKALA